MLIVAVCLGWMGNEHKEIGAGGGGGVVLVSPEFSPDPHSDV